MLPIHQIEPELLQALRADERPSLLIKAPTGSGKSTQVPQMVLDSGLVESGKRIVVLQPRRIAARLLASRVSQERKSAVGKEVGYQVRFENRSSKDTRILYVTEGVLLRQLLADPTLADIGCIVIDEFHERHLDGDLCLAWARQLQREHRPDLRLIVMSATLVAGPLEDFLQPCRLLESEGRTFPVEIHYQAPKQRPNQDPEPVWDQVVRACRQLSQDDGSWLVFLPGAFEIQKTLQALRADAVSKGRDVLPMHGELTPDQQEAALSRGDRPKIIVSTNVAETSLTIEGVTVVIDSGLARVAAYDSRRGINTLTIQKISRASAEQRAGRAGRMRPGTAIRLWSERDHGHRPESEIAEVDRLDLTEALLSLKQAEHNGGGGDRAFAWFQTPPERSLQRARHLLRELSALDEEGRITGIGQQLTRFPLHPRFGRLLLAAAELGCLHEAALCAGLAQGRGIVTRGGKGVDDFVERGDLTDFQGLIRLFDDAEGRGFDLDHCRRQGIHGRACREAAASANQFLQIARRAGLTPNTSPADGEALAKALTIAFIDHLGSETGPSSRVYELAGGYRGHLGKSTLIKAPSLLVAAEITEIQGKALQVQLNHITRVEPEWLEELFPGQLSSGSEPFYDASARRVFNHEVTRFRHLVLSRRQRGEPDPDAAAALLAEEVAEGRLQLPLWNERVEQWITRVNCLARWMPELEITPLEEADRRLIIEQVCQGAISFKQLKTKEVFPALHQWLNPMQRDCLDSYTPERIEITPGRTAKVTYDPVNPPSVSVVLQRLYDVNENPKVANGTVTVTVHLLSPAQRPIQTTSDLGRFWKESYPGVRSEMKGRYPKHEWR